MTKAKKKTINVQDCCKSRRGDTVGLIYILGFIGSLIHYISNATSFWGGVLGVLKAFVWPVFIVMKILGM